MKNVALTILTLLLVAPTASFAEEVKTVEVSGFVYDYDEMISGDTNGDGANDRDSYYKEGKLVLSAYDENGDGKDDLWFEWKDDKVVLEMRASSWGDPDEFVVIDEGEKALAIEIPESGGSLGGGWMWVALLLIVIGAWWYKRKRAMAS